jgi:hypothetical protein
LISEHFSSLKHGKMLKSTYKKPEAPSQGRAAIDEPGLPEGWTAHKAPNGHTYYYNASTKKSTYVKPEAEAPRAPIPSYSSGDFAGGFSNNNFPTQNQHSRHPNPNFQEPRSGRGGYRGGFGQNGQRRSAPEDKPKHRYKISACKPWVLVKTKLGRRFVHNTETGESLWKFPDDVLLAVTDWDIKERERKERRERGEESEPEEVVQHEDDQQEEDESSSEYTEVTDSEEDEENGEGSKRQRTEEQQPDGPIEFNEDDLAAELEEMEEFGFDDDWDYGEDQEPLSEEDSKALFFDLLDDFNIKPFSTWEKVLEDGQIIEDPRYKALPNMKARRDAWDEWSKQKIQELKEKREKQEKKDPKIPYLAFLQEHASTKLYWPEFKRKHRKELVMKELKVPDKDKEKFYREHIKRLQLPQSTLKSELTALLRALPLSVLNRDTTTLPTALLTDIKYYSLAPSTRDPLIETYLTTLRPAPEDAIAADEEADMVLKKQERKRREDALKERERQVEEAKRRQRRDQAYGKGQLREEEMELQRAMNIGRSGLKAQLANVSIEDEAKDSET